MKNYLIKSKDGNYLKNYEVDSYDKVWAVSFVNHHDFAKTFTHDEAIFIAGAICLAFGEMDKVEIVERETV
jgi:hypothetical protein